MANQKRRDKTTLDLAVEEGKAQVVEIILDWATTNRHWDLVSPSINGKGETINLEENAII